MSHIRTSTFAPKRGSTKIDKKKPTDAGLAALVTGLKGAKAVLDTASIPGASAIFSIILSCIEEAQVRMVFNLFHSVTHFSGL